MLATPGFVRPEQWQAQIQALIQRRAKVLVHSALSEEVLRAAHVDQQVVDHAAVGLAHRRVEHAAGEKLGDIVRDEVVQEPGGVRTSHVNLAHVAHVEQPRGAPHRLMLLENAAVLHRHLPACKGDHPAAEVPMDLVQRCLL